MIHDMTTIATKEGAHAVAKEKGIEPWALGCDCAECNKKFKEILDKLKYKGSITYKDNDGLPIPTFHCSNCGHDSEGWSICLKCNPQTYEVRGMSDENKYYIKDSKGDIYMGEIAVRVWNAAIEAAAVEAKRYLNSKNYKGINTEKAIRSLKK